ncbi:MAG: hypothetical protein IPJ41_17785 [Phycisphaerales bacterium]|nr:hypothetical protein [Phycisphaerales bacterium]
MAVATDFQVLRSMVQQTIYDFDPNGTSATDIGWVSMRDSESIMIAFFRTIGTSALTFAILGNTVADGSGTDVTVKTVTVSSEPDAVGDYIFAEVTAAELAQAGIATGVELIGVSASLAFGTGTDEGVVVYTRLGKQRGLNLSTNSIA